MILPPDKLGDLIESYKDESRKLKEQIADLCYHMTGGINWDQAWGLSFEDREILVRTINKRIKEKNPNIPDYL